MRSTGNIRVGRRIYTQNGFIDPSYENFTPILVLTKSSAYGSLSPYELYDEKGRIMENIYQFNKVYENVPYSKQTYSKYDNTVIWEHPSELHAIKSENGDFYDLTDKYFIWRQKGMYNKYAVRYPVGYNHRGKCLFSLGENTDGTINPNPLDYINARKKIYLPLYIKLVKQKTQFEELVKRYRAGENLLIIEVDGPHEESMSYYKNLYGVTHDFIQNNTMLVTPDNLKIMLNDAKHPYGHGYCLAQAITGIEL